MSRLELLVQQWRLTLGMLHRRVHENRIGDAWRFQPLIKVYSFLIKRYGGPDEPAGWRWRTARTIMILLSILFLLSSFAGLWLHLLTGGQFWNWLRDRLAD
jgi:hypothetical protein